MHQGNWTCSSCGGEIKELPFEPRSSSGLTCRDCYFKTKNGEGSAPAGEAPAVQEVPNDIPMDAGLAAEPQADDGLDAAPATSTASGERKMFTGEWQCGTCGGAITELPFEPRNTSNLKCLDCFKKAKS